MYSSPQLPALQNSFITEFSESKRVLAELHRTVATRLRSGKPSLAGRIGVETDIDAAWAVAFPVGLAARISAGGITETPSLRKRSALLSSPSRRRATIHRIFPATKTDNEDFLVQQISGPELRLLALNEPSSHRSRETCDSNLRDA